jgi:hypothetical protein
MKSGRPPAQVEYSQESANNSFNHLANERVTLDETVWKDESLAQDYEETIVYYWDQMIQPNSDVLAVISTVDASTFSVGELVGSDTIEWSIKKSTGGGTPQTFNKERWSQAVRRIMADGYVVESAEFHQSQFTPPMESQPAKSVFSTTLYVSHQSKNRRLIVKGDLDIDWTDHLDARGHYQPQHIGFTHFVILERGGPPAFVEGFILEDAADLPIPILYDVDRDGDSDIIMPVTNELFRNKGNFAFDKSTPLIAGDATPPGPYVMAANMADFTGDGFADLLCTSATILEDENGKSQRHQRLLLYAGDSNGRFLTTSTEILPGTVNMVEPSVVSCGDINGDGTLDLYIGQYKTPYEGGQMPSPFYDANDGYPSYLLVNEGGGHFRNATEELGLVTHRNRRTYSASFVDLDDDVDLDLLVVNDFAGIDIYHNNGMGIFKEVTDRVVEQSRAFGMGHTAADFDRDGLFDFYVIGMASTTMRRLNYMGLGREEYPEIEAMRTTMGYGNRMYIGQGNGVYGAPPFGDSVARTGWSWGATALDFDADGDSDIYISNGHHSGKTTKDYCTKFWCHDIYQGTSEDSVAFQTIFSMTMGQGLSWDGYQRNQLLMNMGGTDFMNVAYLMNLAHIGDGGSVLSDDLDGDGRPDLLFTSKKWGRDGERRYDFHAYRNEWPEPGNWIAVRLQEEPGSPSPVGATIEVGGNGHVYPARVMTGDSYRTQHALFKHFGLGDVDIVEHIAVRWPNGITARLHSPKINTVHLIQYVAER